MLVQENAASLKIIKKRNGAIEHHSSFLQLSVLRYNSPTIINYSFLIIIKQLVHRNNCFAGGVSGAALRNGCGHFLQGDGMPHRYL
ncbi:hypothetical protein SAMN04488505_102956 [Chitinophaga rupis]|uniref:Uncharacterized protein n=1 Tax=Chitinophaga rupis TaxID=573321 RepID=A0A1H7SMK4_9BACT|nr:hypothetical protein SAMN04488505_102956 [Chitinophaga rupis]